MNEKLLIGKSNDKPIFLNTSMLNRHGLIAGATGTGKTVSLKVIAELLSEKGISVIIPDIKGDLISLAKEGEMDDNIKSRISNLNISDYKVSKFPVEVFDIFAENGIATRTTISELGPVLLSKLLDLTEAQEGIINIAFRIADEEGLLLLDMKDLRQMLIYLMDNKENISSLYGNISSQSVGAIQRRLLVLEEQGGDKFFGETALDISDLLKKDENGKGYINIINSQKLIENPALYSTFLFWILTQINQKFPEVGDLDKPKLVFFFDEAHILFDNANSQTLNLVERLVKLIRSKGVGIFFVTQNPTDIPDSVLAQLGNKIQHALRAYTPKEQKSIKAIVDSFRKNPELNLEEEILNLKIGQAIVSTLDEEALPSIAEKVTILPPQSYLGAVDSKFIMDLAERSSLYSKYENTIDPESAFEILTQRIEQEELKRKTELEKIAKEKLEKAEEKEAERLARQEAKLEKERLREEIRIQKEREKQISSVTRTAKSFGNSIVRSIGYRIGRDLYGMIKDLGKNNKR